MKQLIEDLSKPDSMPDPTKNVSVIQTHISIVFVADNFVYKIKKPVNFGFLDFSDPEKRKHYCSREVELNRRLSTGIYLDVIPVTFDGKSYRLGSRRGETVDHAVRMKRVPEDILMKTLFFEGTLTESHLGDIAQVLARFHRTTDGGPAIERFGEADAFKVNTDENFVQIEPYIGRSMDQKTFFGLKDWTEDFFSNRGELFASRIAQGKIRDCHGDLHMEHVCLGDQVSVIDCIEFNERFRYCDTIADFAFLLMDLEFHGGAAQSERLWDFYRIHADEGDDVEDLLTFYKVYRAMVRGKVNSFQLDDANISEDKRLQATETAADYFKLAYSYIG
ncbi:MAG: phosphotransferase [Desulfatiglandaceae bacterium]